MSPTDIASAVSIVLAFSDDELDDVVDRILPQVGEEGMTSPRVLSVKWHGFIYHRIPEWRCDSLGNEFFEMRRAARDEVGHYFPRIIWARTAHRSLEHTNTEVKISR